MALYVNTNVSSLNGRNKLTNASNALNTTFQRLSSGLRINSAKDDAAGLQIADRLTSQINGLNQGNRNTNDAIALAQTMEGALDETTNMLQRIRTLAVQSANGTNTAKDREAIQAEVAQLSEEITRIAEKTTFGGSKILNKYDATAAGKTSLVTEIKGAGGAGNTYGIVLQVGANAGDNLTLKVASNGFSLQSIGSIANKANFTKACLTGNKGVLDVGTASKAKNVLSVIDSMIGVVDAQRGQLGAMQNRMESTIRNQANVSMNTADARSRIRDADFAEEGANLTQQNIIQQAASAMLTQANMRPQIALGLIG